MHFRRAGRCGSSWSDECEKPCLPACIRWSTLTGRVTRCRVALLSSWSCTPTGQLSRQYSSVRTVVKNFCQHNLSSSNGMNGLVFRHFNFSEVFNLAARVDANAFDLDQCALAGIDTPFFSSEPSKIIDVPV